MVNLPDNPFLQLIPSRIPPAMDRVERMIWETMHCVDEIECTEPSPQHYQWASVAGLARRKVTAFPHMRGKLWDQQWVRIALPSSMNDRRIFLEWRDQSESTLHIDGLPYYGFDVAHKKAPLPSGTREVWIESVVCQTGIWHPQATGLSPDGSVLDGASLLHRNETAWRVHCDLQVLADLMREELKAAFPGRDHEFGAIGTKPTLGVLPPLLRRLLRWIERVLNTLETNGLEAAKTELEKAFIDLPGSHQPPAAILTGHAHIDLVWLWPEHVGEFKAVHTFATANRLMDEYPEFLFGYSQPASYEAVARRSPEMMHAVRRRIAENRWEACGATYVESDTLLACGEALARSFLLGQKGFETLTGKPSRVLWLPDVFGYSGCIPQLMRESGADSFFTTKLTWNAVNAFPYSSFRWVGADGSEVVAHICQNNGYNQTVSAKELRTGAAAHRQCDVHSEFLAPTGFGDGGGGVTEEMCESARRCASLSGLPSASWGRIDGFFERLGRLREALPASRGELYFEYHRGTYTTHSDIKAGLRHAERATQAWEAAACLRGGKPIDEAHWKRVVFAQFHDYIPGSSVHEVYDEARVELKNLSATAAENTLKILGAPNPSGHACVFNPLPQPLTLRHEGQTYRLPPLSASTWKDLTPLALPEVRATLSILENGRVRAKFDALGRITSLEVDGAEIPLTGPAGGLFLYPDHPHAFEAWDIDRHTLSLGVEELRHAEVFMGDGEVVFTRPLGKKSRVEIHYRLEPGDPVLRIRYQLDWQEQHTLLKASFPTGFLGRDARFGAPFGSVKRSQWPGPTTSEAMWEVPGSRWAVVTDDSECEGFFAVTEAKFGFSCREGCLGLSLVRSAKITSEDCGRKAGSHPEPIRRTLSPHEVSDIGLHTIDLAIGRFHSAMPRVEQPAALAESLFQSPVFFDGQAGNSGFLGLEGGESLQPVWAVPVDETSWTLRLHETLGRTGRTLLLLAPGWKATRVDLSGNPHQAHNSTEPLCFTAYQVVSLLLTRHT
jgi:alpha-mannosidase